MSDTVTCADCDTPITGESLNGDPAQRKPCPKCGSTGRKIPVSVNMTFTVSMGTQALLITYPQVLLSSIKSLIDSSQYNIAVVVAHMACEFATERALSRSFADKGIDYLEDAVTAFLNGRNLNDDRIRKLYTALTGDQIQEQGFWQDFKTSASNRNKIIHGGLTVGKEEAEKSYQAASDLVDYLNNS